VVTEVFDLGLPAVLLEPQRWVRGSPLKDELWIIPLEIAALNPGVLGGYFAEVRQWNFAWRVAAELFRDSPRAPTQRAFRHAEARRLLGENPKFVGDANRASDYQKIFALQNLPTMLPIANLSQPTLLEWVAAIAPEFSKDFPTEARGLLRLRAARDLDFWLKNYAKQFPEVLQFPWEGLRFFAGYLRSQKLFEAAQNFERAWSKFQALFSPQDENSERRSLLGDEVMLNPTAQIIKHSTQNKRHVTVVVRQGLSVKEVHIDPIAAAVLDEVQESARISRIRLVAQLNAEMKALFPEVNFEASVQRLIDDSVILARQNPL